MKRNDLYRAKVEAPDSSQLQSINGSINQNLIMTNASNPNVA